MTPLSPETYLSSIRAIAASCGDDIATMTERVLTYPGFMTWSGSVDNRHHYGAGGLLKHTYEVVALCMSAAPHGQFWGHQIDERVLFMAAVAHDRGKVLDYSGGNTLPWVKTSHHRLIHHVTRGALLWAQDVAATGLCRDIEDDVTHCILSHHGSPEYGSPIRPKTREAWILHLSDQMSARMDDCDRVDLR